MTTETLTPEAPDSSVAAPTPAPAPTPASPVIGPDPFVHLHVHSEFSILDGISNPYDLVRTAGNAGQPAIALTDHKRLSGVVDFWEAAAWYNSVHAERHDAASCAKRHASGKDKDRPCHSVADCIGEARCPKGKRELPPEGVHGTIAPIKPILGIETYVAHNGRESREKGDWGHLVLLAMDETGWRNIRILSARASLEGFYSHPRIDLAMLEEQHEGLVALSSCLGGHLAKVWREGGPEAGDALIREYQRIVGADNYFLEVQWHNDQDLSGPERAHEQHDLNRYLIGASARTGARIVMTNDLHYAKRTDAIREEIVLANQQQMSLAEVAEAKAAGKSVLSFDTPDFYVKTRKEMQLALVDWLGQATVHDPETAAAIRASGKDWLNETLSIAERATLKKPWISGELHFPRFPIPEAYVDHSIADEARRAQVGADRYLAQRVWDKAPGRFPNMDERIKRLIAYELQCIQELGFAPYFLITEDFCDYARKQGVENDDPIIEVGLGRGSAAGSVITYILGITDLDPIFYGLSEGGIGFTRFLNPIVRYFARLDDFGALPAGFGPDELPAPDLDEMIAALRDELNNRAAARGAALRDGTATDYVTGKPYSPDRLKLELDRWKDHRTVLLDEWTQIKRMAAYEVGPQNRTLADYEGEGFRLLIDYFWRWLMATHAGHAPGDANVIASFLAPFLGLTTVGAPGMVTYRSFDGKQASDLPLLPHYRFEQARIGMPDIDIDFTPGPDGREKVMRYVTDKYGADHVTQIATFGTMLAKSAIKDVARAKGMPPAEGDALSQLVPKKFQEQKGETDEDQAPGVSLREMLTSTHSAVVEGSREMRAAMLADPKVDEIIRLAAELEGNKRTVSTHACGVLITPEPVIEYVSVEKTDKGAGTQAVHDGPTLTDKLGLLKVDFLGLKNLKINRACVDRILETHGEVVNWRTVPDDDPLAMKLLSQGRTLGIFQFAGMGAGILKRMKPTKVGDLMVATALGRPGPMVYIDTYVQARTAGHGTYAEPTFAKYAAPILDQTYGVLVYQEQMMRLAIELAGFSLPESDGLRKATGKKDAVKMASYKDQFVAGAVAKGVDKTWIENWWTDTLEPFASYAFNFSHSACYAMTAYKQAYLKAHYLPEFTAALMTVDQQETAKERGTASPLSLEIAEARSANLDVMQIDINKSTDRVEIEELSPERLADPTHKGTWKVGLRLSMAAIKGVGDKPVQAIVAEREANGPFTSFGDFMTRMIEREREIDPETGRKVPAPVNKTVVECLVKVGAFDAFDDRQMLLLRLESYFGTTSVKKRAAIDWSPTPAYDRDAVRPQDYLDWEHALLGVYTSAHPSDGINPADVEAYEAEVEAHEKKSAYDRGKQMRLIETGVVADILAHDRVRDESLRIVPGTLVGVTWKANRSGVGGRFVGKIEDRTGSASFTYWRPRDGDPSTAHVAFRAFEAAVAAGTINGSGAALVGAFSYNEKYHSKSGPEISVYEWKPMALPRMVVAPKLEKLVSAVDTEKALREAELFGVGAAGPTPAKPAAAPDAAPVVQAPTPVLPPVSGDLFDI